MHIGIVINLKDGIEPVEKGPFFLQIVFGQLVYSWKRIKLGVYYIINKNLFQLNYRHNIKIYSWNWGIEKDWKTINILPYRKILVNFLTLKLRTSNDHKLY